MALGCGKTVSLNEESNQLEVLLELEEAMKRDLMEMVDEGIIDEQILEWRFNEEEQEQILEWWLNEEEEELPFKSQEEEKPILEPRKIWKI